MTKTKKKPAATKKTALVKRRPAPRAQAAAKPKTTKKGKVVPPLPRVDPFHVQRYRENMTDAREEVAGLLAQFGSDTKARAVRQGTATPADLRTWAQSVKPDAERMSLLAYADALEKGAWTSARKAEPIVVDMSQPAKSAGVAKEIPRDAWTAHETLLITFWERLTDRLCPLWHVTFRLVDDGGGDDGHPTTTVRDGGDVLVGVMRPALGTQELGCISDAGVDLRGAVAVLLRALCQFIGTANAGGKRARSFDHTLMARLSADLVAKALQDPMFFLEHKLELGAP